MGKNYVVKEIDGQLFYDDAQILRKDALKHLDHEIRMKILNLLHKKPMYPVQIAKALKMHEQKIYYHIKQLLKADVLEIAERKEIRGTTAKKFRPKSMNFAYTLNFMGKNINQLQKENKDSKLDQFLYPFIQNQKMNTKIIVGSPDPHGPFKARARDGHYAIDLALFLGRFCSLSKSFVTMLDVDVNSHDNMIIVGGPVTNLAMAKINDDLPVKFSDKKPWGIVGKESYTDDNIGFIAKIPNPHNPNLSIMCLAGIRYGGTKAAVLGLTRFSKLVLSRFTEQKEFYCIVEGFDLDGDGKVDSIDVLE